MIYILFSGLFFSAAIGLAAWQKLRRKRRNLALRLAHGRGKLLEEEIAAQEKNLDKFDLSQLKTVAQHATRVLDELTLALGRRQTLMQTCEDLAHLQQYKLELLSAHPPPEPKSVQTSTRTGRRRDSLEQDLLSRVGHHNPPRVRALKRSKNK